MPHGNNMAGRGRNRKEKEVGLESRAGLLPGGSCTPGLDFILNEQETIRRFQAGNGLDLRCILKVPSSCSVDDQTVGGRSERRDL